MKPLFGFLIFLLALYALDEHFFNGRYFAQVKQAASIL